MDELVEIHFKYERKGYYVNPRKIKLQHNQYVIVEAEKGADIGRVAQFPINPGEFAVDINNIKKIVRVAEKEDLKKLARIHEMEKEAQKKFNEALKTQPFNMHLIDVEYQFDGNKLTFYFIAESRIDFRDFLKDLARIFRTRIELRQISEQQEIERLGGIGPCGREFCCKSLHLNFGRVTTQVIKDQNITAATSKITGPCGRLLCCMAYEEEFYKEKAKEFPNLDDEVIYHDKRMKVTKNNYLVSTVELKDENEVRATISLAEYNMMKMKKERKISKFSSIIGHHKTKVRK